MVDVAAYMGAGAVLPDRRTSLVNPISGNAIKSCPDSPYFQEITGDGNWKWRRWVCRKWSCDPCREYRIKRELVPEVVAAFGWAAELGCT